MAREGSGVRPRRGAPPAWPCHVVRARQSGHRSHRAARWSITGRGGCVPHRRALPPAGVSIRPNAVLGAKGSPWAGGAPGRRHDPGRAAVSTPTTRWPRAWRVTAMHRPWRRPTARSGKQSGV